MSKNVIISVFLCAALVICYGVEHKIYQQKTYCYYKNLKMELSTYEDSKEATSRMILSTKAMDENAEAARNQKIAYLSFDDGPSQTTKEVLKVLKEENVTATFFLIGNQITEETKPILEEMIANGNCIGIHTYSHSGKSIYNSKESYLEDFEHASSIIKETTGLEPKIFRFPWGSANNYMSNISEDVIKTLETKGYTYFDWNVSAEDSVGSPTSWSILNNIRKDYKKYNKPVILMHDSSINKLSAQLLPDIIKMLKEEGYTFDTLDHMENPYQYPRD